MKANHAGIEYFILQTRYWKYTVDMILNWMRI